MPYHKMLSSIYMLMIGFCLLFTGTKTATGEDGDLPTSNASAVGWASANDGTVILDNDAQASHNPSTGNFEGYSASNSYHYGKNGKVTGMASSSAGGGSPFAWSHPENWLIYPGAAVSSGGNAWQGILHNLDNATAALLHQYLGHGSSKINGTGTNINLHSSANASTIVAQKQKVKVSSRQRSSEAIPGKPDSANIRRARPLAAKPSNQRLQNGRARSPASLTALHQSQDSQRLNTNSRFRSGRRTRK